MDDSETTAAALHDRIRAGETVRVLDIRDRQATEQWRIDGESVAWTHVPRARVLAAQATGSLDEIAASVPGEGPITVVCAEGKASAEVAGFLRGAGHEAENLAGGMGAWGRLYPATTVERVSEVTLVQYRRPATGCLAYLVVSGEEAAVVDPLAAFADRYAADAREHGATLTAAVDTHVHADHVSGVRAVAAATEADAVVPQGTIDRGADIEARPLTDGAELTVGDATLRALHAPGHTTDMTAFRVGEALLSGDSVFVESVARPDLETDAEVLAGQLYRTLHDRFGALPGSTVVCPGHYGPGTVAASDGTYTATLGTLREQLRAFSMSEDEFREYVVSDLPPQPANAERIIGINLGHEAVEAADARELELGPNNCAVRA